jgi:hypothetical protein
VRLLHLAEVSLHLCGPAMLHSEEVSLPKTINIKQYLSTNHFLVNNRPEKINYQASSVASCFDFLIKLNEKILILSRFVTKNGLFM